MCCIKRYFSIEDEAKLVFFTVDFTVPAVEKVSLFLQEDFFQ